MANADRESDRRQRQPGIDFEVVYQLLKEVIEREDVISYRGLSEAYEQKTGKRVHWRNWTATLDVLGAWSRRMGLPTLAAVVVNAQDGMPGERFFRPSTATRTLWRKRWAKLIQQVYQAEWPQTMRGPQQPGQEQEK